MKEIEFFSKRCAKKQLTKKSINDKTTFASYYDEKDSEWLSNVGWSDKLGFRLPGDAPERGIKRSDERLMLSCTKRTLKYGNEGIMVGKPCSYWQSDTV